MQRKAVGFYWTLPMPWAGFTKLPDRVEEAAKASKTIRYQRELIQHYARDEGYRIIHEEVFLEIEPDRGSELIQEPLKKVERLCFEHSATLLYVDFSEMQRWRSHSVLLNWSRSTNIKMECITSREILIDGQFFDPHAHFRKWREQQTKWTDGKHERFEKALSLATVLREQGFSYPKIADSLNSKKIASPSGKPWTADNVRKLLPKSLSSLGSPAK